MTNQNKNKSDGLENAVMGIGKSLFLVFRICTFGIRRINFKSFDMWASLIIVISIFASLLLGGNNYLEQGIKLLFNQRLPFYFRLFFYLSPKGQFITLMIFFMVVALLILGFKEFKKYVVFQKAIDRAGLKTATGEIPKIKAILPSGENRCKVIVETFGVGLGKFEVQKDSLTAGFRQTVESIKLASDKGKVEIHLCERDLPNIVGFHELYDAIKEPYSFIIGQSL
ncbi:MAG: hypothetical protein KDD45_04155, partial [Bdellovibrionales bacterium]|nr:hypothetical protein [Bdellovibrionales bacterium]